MKIDHAWFGCAVWPWEAEPYRLWSLLDMQRLSVGFMVAASNLERAKIFLGYDFAEDNESRATFAKTLDEFIEQCADLPLRRPFIAQVEHVKAQARETFVPVMSLVALMDQLQRSLYNELCEFLFFAVPPDRKWAYLDPTRWFGTDADVKFPDIRRDVRDACQCYAVGQWTATVFHSMRILEHGMRWLASAVGLPATSVERENWKTILDQIEREIRVMEQRPQSPQKSVDIQFYSEAASGLRLFKEAWRNHVSHSRASYDEQDAKRILDAVKHFMAHVASRVP